MAECDQLGGFRTEGKVNTSAVVAQLLAALERFTVAVGLDRADERIATTSTVVATGGGPRGYVGQGSRVPPERHAPRSLAFRRRCAQAQVRSGGVEHHVIKLQRGKL